MLSVSCPVLKTGLINQANGSAYIEMENTKIACAMCVTVLWPVSKRHSADKFAFVSYGPRPRPPPYAAEGTLNVEVKYAPFASDPRRFPLRVRWKSFAAVLRTFLLTF